MRNIIRIGAGTDGRNPFGRFKGKPIWEVKAGSSYYVVDFKTGKVTGVF